MKSKTLANKGSIDKFRAVAWDTSSHALVLAARHQKKCATLRIKAPKQHSESLMPHLVAVLKKLKLKELDVVGVGLGPGSFTGLRIGVTAAKSMAYASKAKLIGLSSLEIISRNVIGEKRPICVVQDAKRQKVYTATYAHGNVIQKPQIIHSGEFLFQITKQMKDKQFEVPFFVGDGVAIFQEALKTNFGRKSYSRNPRHWYPQAEPLLDLALERFIKKRFASALTLTPEYLYEETCNVR